MSVKLAIATVLCIATSAFAQPKQADITVEVVPVYASGWQADITLTNRGNSRIEIADADLPWRNRYGMVFVAAEARRPNAPLRVETFPIDDALGNREVLAPRGTLKGRVSLDRYFDDLGRALRDCDVIVHWSFDMSPVTGIPRDRIYGGFVLPKTGK